MEPTSSRGGNPQGNIERASSAAHDTVDRVAQTAAAYAERLGERAEEWMEMKDNWVEGAREYVREHPVAATSNRVSTGPLRAPPAPPREAPPAPGGERSPDSVLPRPNPRAGTAPSRSRTYRPTDPARETRRSRGHRRSRPASPGDGRERRAPRAHADRTEAGGPAGASRGPCGAPPRDSPPPWGSVARARGSNT